MENLNASSRPKQSFLLNQNSQAFIEMPLIRQDSSVQFSKIFKTFNIRGNSISISPSKANLSPPVSNKSILLQNSKLQLELTKAAQINNDDSVQRRERSTSPEAFKIGSLLSNPNNYNNVPKLSINQLVNICGNQFFMKNGFSAKYLNYQDAQALKA